MTACPIPKQLQQWLADALSEAESQAIEAHVMSCTDVCQPLIDSFSGFEDDVTSVQPKGITAAPAVSAQAGGAPAPQAGETPTPQSAAFPSLPGYEILGELGRGGMGVVYKARHRRMDRVVAIKVLPAGLVQDAAAVARFEREVKAAAKLRHTNIVATDTADEAGGVHFLVMEFVEGVDLAALVRRGGPLPVPRAVDFVLQAARGLDYAHRHGVVHRDIKPGNMLIDHEGTVKVLDMGLARLDSSVGSEQAELTRTDQIMGTIDFMAPEQALDTKHADVRSDVYSLGITLFFLLTGQKPFRGENTLATLLAHREQAPPSLCAARAGTPTALEAVFLKMVAKQPANRYQSMAEVISALEDGLPRPSSDVGWDKRADERRPTMNDAGRSTAALGCGPIGVAVAAPAASPALDPTLTLQTADVDTDPNTEQSLAVSIAASPPRHRGRRRNVLTGSALAGLLAIAAAAAFVIRMQTGEGEVVVESEVGGISLDILRDGEPVKEDWQVHAGADNRWFVRTGTVEVKLPANLQGQFSVEQDTAGLIRDGKILVKITRKKKADASAVVAEDRDRAAAQWVLAQGGFVQFSVNSSGSIGSARNKSDLPSEPFQVFQINLNGLSAVTSADLDRFARLSRLNILQLAGTKIDSEAIARLVQMRLLDSLNIQGTGIQSSQLASLAALKKLNRIDLTSAQQNDDGYAGLTKLAGLRELVLHRSSADDLKQLAKLRQLRTLWLPDVRTIDEKAIHELHATTPLCRVLVDVRPVRPLGHDPIGELARRLRAKGAELDIRDFDPPGKATPVKNDTDIGTDRVFDIARISLPANVSLDDEELSWLRCPCSFWVFDAIGGTGADRYAAAFIDHPILSYISLRDSDLSDAGLASLSLVTFLESLDVRGTKVTRAGVEALQKALPDCKILWEPPASSAPAAEDRDRAAAEWVLAQGGNVTYVAATGDEVRANSVSDLPSTPFQVHSVELWGAKTVRNEDLERLAGLTRLEYCWLDETDIDAGAIARLVKVSRLRGLGVSGTRIKSSELGGLAALPRLDHIELKAGDQIDDEWAALRQLPALRELTLHGATSDDLRRLSRLSRLRTIFLPIAENGALPTAIDDAVAQLRAANPLCRVLVGGGNAAYRAVGRDSESELARRLLASHAALSLVIAGEGVKATDEDLSAGKPVSICSIELKPEVSLTAEDLGCLSCSAATLVDFIAHGVKDADRYAEALVGNSSLLKVAFTNSDLSDVGLDHLKRLALLTTLDVQGTKVTAAGVEKLHAVLSSCRITSDHGTFEPAPAGGAAERK
ncbi:MAG TPA: serine/threonine-protein kinase [Pirellulales bacterium]|nr:serine/threonine-protein kinase [Pirellulales bacterium]